MKAKYTNQTFEVDQELMDALHAKYPDVNLDQEIRNAAGWAASRPPKKKWDRFLHNWMAKAQENTKLKPIQRRPQPKPASEIHMLNREVYEETWLNLDGDGFRERVLRLAQKNPMQFFRGFVTTNWRVKKIRPDLWKQVSQDLADLIGRDRARKLWTEKTELLKDLTLD